MVVGRLRVVLALLRQWRAEREFFGEWDRQGWEVPFEDDPYRLCPRCEQGSIQRMRVRSTQEFVRVCDECDATWGEPSATGFEDLTSYLRERGIAGGWDQLVEAD